MLAAADGIMASAGTPYGVTYVGNTQTGEIRGYNVNMVPELGGAPIPPGFHMFSPSQAMRDQYSAYVDLLKSRNGIGGVVDIVGTIAPMSFPSSAFDVTEDGAGRNALMQFAGDTSQWPACCEAQRYYAKLILQHGKQFYTGADYLIRLSFKFQDGGTVVINYDSTCQCLKFVEARDSAGNLIATASAESVPVDYSSYAEPDARYRADYARGIQWLQQRGVVVVGAGGTVTVRSGVVIVGGVVKVNEK